MTYQSTTRKTLNIERRGASAWVWMNRPEVHNAFDETLIAELTEAVGALDGEEDVRAIVLAGVGNSFSAFVCSTVRSPVWGAAPMPRAPPETFRQKMSST